MELFRLFGSILIDNKDANNELDKTDKKGESLGQKFGHITKTVAIMGTAIVGAGAVAGGALFALANKASNLSEAQNVVNETFKTSKDSILAWAKTLADSAGISETNATKFVGAMGAMLLSSGLTEDAAAGMAKSMVQLAGDMSSFYNLDNETAWEKIRAGISGETEPLKQLGINMSVANLEAYGMANGMNKAYKEMSQAEQTQLRYNYLMDVTANAQGDFGRTLETSFPNQLRVAKLNIEKLTTAIGQQFIPGFLDAFKKINEYMPEIQAFISNAFEKIQAVIEPILPIVIDLVKKGFNVLKEAIEFISDAINDAIDFYTKYKDIIDPIAIAVGAAALAFNIWSAAVGIWTFVTTVATPITVAFGAAVAFLTSPVFLVTAAIGILIGIVFLLWKHWDSIVAFLKTSWDAVVNAFNTAINAIGDFFKGLWEGIVKIFAPVVEWFGNIFKGAWEAIVNIFSPIVEWFGQLFKALLAIIWKVNEPIIKFFVKVWDGIVGIFTPIIKWFGDIFTSAWEGVKSAFSAVGKFFTDVWDGIVKIFTPIVNWFGDQFKKAWESIKAVFSVVSDFFQGIFDKVVGIFSKVGSAIGDAVSGAFKWVINGVLGIVEGVINSIIKGINKVTGFLTKISGVDINQIPEFNIPRLEKGGDITRSGRVLVGEAGPEFLDLPDGARVTPLNKAGGATFNFYDTRVMGPNDIDYLMEAMTKRARQLGVVPA